MEYNPLFLFVLIFLICSLVIGVAILNNGGGAQKSDAGNKTGELGERYINEYVPGSPPDWRPDDYSPEETPEDKKVNAYEVTRFPDSEPTPEDFDSAWEKYRKSYEAVDQNGWFDFGNATEDGYENHDGLHYVNREYYSDNETLNPHRPESLIYYDDPQNESGKVLAGIMYVADSLETEGEQFGGPLTVWHYHPRESKMCFAQIPPGGTECSKEDTKMYRTPEMIHIWFLKNPEGPFASRMGVPEKYLKEPERMSEGEFKNYTREKYEKYLSQG